MYIYYVYAYLRSKDSKTAKAGTPYYIGKGKGRRAWTKGKGEWPKPISSKYIVLLETGLSEIGALALERRMIRWYGRVDNSIDGILRNKTDGGDGVSGRTLSKDEASVISARQQKKVSNGEHPFQNKDWAKHRSQKVIAEGKAAFQQPGFSERMSIIANKHQLQRVENGTHHFLGGELQRSAQRKHVESGTHHFLDSDYHKQCVSKQLQNGRHASQIKKTCSHCQKVCDSANYNRWHGDNCRYKFGS